MSCPWCHVAIPIPSSSTEDNNSADVYPKCAACLSSKGDEILPSANGGPACRAQTLSEAELVDRATEALNSDLKFALKGKASKSKKKAKLIPEDNGDRGKLWSIAARVLMKLLYCARMARYDLLRPVCHLACHVSKWTSECDRRLHKLVCYVNCTLHLRMIG